MSQRRTVSGRRSALVWLAVVVVLMLAVALAAVVFIIGPQQQLRQQAQATAEARQAEVERLYVTGVAFQDAGDCEQAAESLTQLIRLEPGYKEAQSRLAEVRACQQATETTATAQAVAMAQATMEAQATATGEAKAVAEQARLDARVTATAQIQATATAQAGAATATMDAVETHYQKGLAYINLEKWAEAQMELETVFEVDPNYKDVQAQLAVVDSELVKLTPTATPTPSTTPTPEITPTPTLSPLPENAASLAGRWEVVSFLPYGTGSHTLVTVVGDYVFTLGPDDPAEAGYASTYVIRAPILEDGTIGEWESTTPLPRRVLAGDVVAVSDTIYVFGGKAHGDQEHPYSNVIYGVVDDDGIITAWNETTPLPTGLRDPAAVVYRGAVYVIGGGQWHGKPDEYGLHHYDTVYQAIIKPDGSLSSWANANIPAPMKGYFSAFVLDNYLYLLAPGTHGSYVSEIAWDGVLSPWQRLGDTVIRSEVVVDRVLYGVVEGRLSSLNVAASHRFADYAEGPQLPRPEGILLYSHGVFYFISGDVVFALLDR